MKPLSYTFFVIFLAFTVVQYNDPDSLIWMLFYLALAMVSLAGGLGRAKSSWFVVAMIAVAFGAGQYYHGAIDFLTNEDGIAFSQGMQNNFPYIEQAREFGGLVISFLGLLGMWWLHRSAAKA